MSYVKHPLGFCVALIAMSVTMSAHGYDSAKWRPLFNGRDLDGWSQVGPGQFVIEDGQLRTDGGMGLLWYTREKLADVVIRIVYRTPDAKEAGNSGIFIRIPTEPTEPWMPVNRGYEVQIDDSEDDLHRTGVLYSFTKALGTPRAREWNTMEITLDGERTMVVVNGTKITDYREGEPVPEKKSRYEPDRGLRSAAGYIGLQNHDAKDVVYFREISVRKLKGKKQ